MHLNDFIFLRNRIVLLLHHNNNKNFKIMKTVITKCGTTLRVGNVYPKGSKFFGKVMIYHDGFNTPSRFDVKKFNDLVEDKDKI